MIIELDPNLRKKWVDVLALVPGLRERKDRDAWLARNLPRNVEDQIRRDDNCRNDLTFIINTVQGLQLKDGRWPILILIDDVLAKEARDLSMEQDLVHLRQNIQRSLEPPTGLDILPREEIIIGEDEKVPISFLENGLRAARAVARVMVSRTIGGRGFGTGWLIAPGLFVTNHHVIKAREPHESDATLQEFEQQARGSVAWFGYDVGSYAEYYCTDLVHANKALDYAVLRLADKSIDDVPLADWSFLRVVRIQPNLTPGVRLNVIQHPGGRVKEIALRSNFYIGNVPDRGLFHYLSDTERGSSGSPVLDNNWQVVGLHHAWDSYDRYYKDRPIRFNSLGLQYATPSKFSEQVVAAINEGFLLHTILKDLPESVRQEIEHAQGWA
ncbi:MAG: trypsin-like peptidase domain-containing protein [Thermoflexales bacterium]|nr:trypsin-like peptidase domain-containing protein [Thermoflexales bacterium]